ncbi:MAG: NAD-dependent epimerase/dehydratase family protein [Deltaproteobacteria bacterium]|nr:MAG: NAD-dependent epimerase/dehydratase family protein [Deltaproteobacteria bacterium]
MKRVLITGANGFIGRNISEYFLAKGYDVVCTYRSKKHQINPNKSFIIGDMSLATSWETALSGVDIVVHLAARVHIKVDSVQEELNEYRKVNVDGTMALATAAVKAGVKRLIYLSSIKVNGEGWMDSQHLPYTESCLAQAKDFYGISKYEAEQALLNFAHKAKLEVVIIRPPLVYGPEVKSNFLSMMKWLYKGVPLPLGSIHNHRSLVALDNLISFIETCMFHPAAVNQIFLVSDGEDLSTTELLRRTSLALGVSPRLIPIPIGVIMAMASLLGKQELAHKLCASLRVDISKACRLLNWAPPISIDQALKKTAHDFLNKNINNHSC